MIQRIQSLYLLLSTICSVYCLSNGIGHFYNEEGERLADMYNLWLTSVADGTHNFYPFALFVLLLITATLSLLSIFLFTRRALQMRVTSFCMILLVGWYITYGVFAYLLCGNMEAQFRPHWVVVLPAVSLILQYLAFRGIMKDEMLVRSLDRLR